MNICVAGGPLPCSITQALYAVGRRPTSSAAAASGAVSMHPHRELPAALHLDSHTRGVDGATADDVGEQIRGVDPLSPRPSAGPRIALALADVALKQDLSRQRGHAYW